MAARLRRLEAERFDRWALAYKAAGLPYQKKPPSFEEFYGRKGGAKKAMRGSGMITAMDQWRFATAAMGAREARAGAPRKKAKPGGASDGQ